MRAGDLFCIYSAPGDIKTTLRQSCLDFVNNTCPFLFQEKTHLGVCIREGSLEEVTSEPLWRSEKHAASWRGEVC